MAENTLTLDAEVLRFTNLHARSPLDFINENSEKRNPYLRRVIRMEKMEEEKAAAAATVADDNDLQQEQQKHPQQSQTSTEEEVKET